MSQISSTSLSDGDEEEQGVYTVQWKPKDITTNRKEKFDGVYVPPQPKEVYKPMPPEIPLMVPTKPNKPMYNPKDDDTIMEDDSKAKKSKSQARSHLAYLDNQMLPPWLSH